MDTYEQFIRWYLRFNGFLTVESFVVHEPDRQRPRVPAGTESDILAVRFPYSKERPEESSTAERQALKFTIRNHDKLFDDEAIAKSLTDFVIAEVKGGQNSLNRTWRAPDREGRYLGQVAYLVRWLGAFRDEGTISEIATSLLRDYRYVHGQYLFRLVYFSAARYQFATTKKILQLTFRDVAEFFVDDRIACWERTGLGVRSFHGQWHPLIKKVWELGEAEGLSRDERVDSILNELRTARAHDQRDQDSLPVHQ